jgi:hypothetical protein
LDLGFGIWDFLFLTFICNIEFLKCKFSVF